MKIPNMKFTTHRAVRICMFLLVFQDLLILMLPLLITNINPITTTTTPNKLCIKIKGVALPRTIEKYAKLIMRGSDKINNKKVIVRNTSWILNLYLFKVPSLTLIATNPISIKIKAILCKPCENDISSNMFIPAIYTPPFYFLNIKNLVLVQWKFPINILIFSQIVL